MPGNTKRHVWGRPQGRPVLGNEVHVWRVALDRAPSDVAPFWEVLAPDERRRAERFHFERDGARFAVARAALRMVLGRYLGVDPVEVAFDYGRRGKPRLVGASPPVRFNVSHSDGLALLAFARGRELGVDVERARDLADLEEIAERFFSTREASTLGALPPAERRAAFFRCWTRKEAWIKATGEGLAQPLDAFEVSLTAGEAPRLERVVGQPGEAERWWFADLAPARGYAGALAVRGRPSGLARWNWDRSKVRKYGARRDRRQDHLQGGPQPRRAVLDLAG